jgi:Tol biopolymer transport system component/Ca2+-binding RTX toxin-like protein
VGHTPQRGGRRGRAISLAAVAGALCLLLLPSAAGFPGAPGKIAFATDRDGNFEIYSMTAGGADPTNLTNSAATSDASPAFSADGTKLAFVRDGEIHRMNGDGSAVTPLTTAGGTEPAWSHDGTKIVFVRDGDVWVMSSTDGSGATNLTSTPSATEKAPAWSPDGTKIAFSSDRDGNDEIYTANAVDGSSPLRLTTSAGADGDPNWSPDGAKIAFVTERDGNPELYVMNNDGASPLRLTNDSIVQAAPSWSPAGTNIAYRATDSGNDDVYVIPSTGGSGTPLTTGAVSDGEPDWGASIANTALPTISGPTTLGSTLTATTGTWASYSALTYSYQWRRCNSVGASCAAITGATNSSYALVSADVGSTMRVAVTATSADGSATAESAATAVVTGGAPVNTTAPTISGSASVGSVLTSGNGIWSGTTPITFTRVWQRCNSSGGGCANISGATGTSYVVTSTDVGSTLRIAVTATNTAGSATASSAATGVVTASGPVNTVAPSITGTPRVATLLSALRGTWTGTAPITYAYQWQRCNSSGASCTNIAGAASTSYTPTTTDLGSTLRVVVTASNSAGSASATSPATVAVAQASSGGSGSTTSGAPLNTTRPRVIGTPVRGRTLTAERGTWTGSAPLTYSYQWERCDRNEDECNEIAGATRSSYTLVSNDVGQRLRVVVTATNSAGEESETSAATQVVAASTASGSTGSTSRAIRGTKRADVLLGTPGNDTILPGAGADTVVAGAGNDVIEAADGTRDVIVCGEGVDSVKADRIDVLRDCERVSYTAKGKTIKGTRRADVLIGGSGNDTILPGRGRDTILAGAGNDVIDSVDGARDVVDCGPGRDRVTADRVDLLNGCEVRNVKRR